MMMLLHTECLCSSILQNTSVGRVESDASHHVSELGTVHHPVTTVPEVKQIEHVPYIWQTSHTSNVCTWCELENITTKVRVATGGHQGVSIKTHRFFFYISLIKERISTKNFCECNWIILILFAQKLLNFKNLWIRIFGIGDVILRSWQWRNQLIIGCAMAHET